MKSRDREGAGKPYHSFTVTVQHLYLVQLLPATLEMRMIAGLAVAIGGQLNLHAALAATQPLALAGQFLVHIVAGLGHFFSDLFGHGRTPWLKRRFENGEEYP
jgi:hypothetical protein